MLLKELSKLLGFGDGSGTIITNGNVECLLYLNTWERDRFKMVEGFISTKSIKTQLVLENVKFMKD